ncbi:low molecular weight phosphatase family protein [Homoserinibacter sp. GY 40078]|uniref:arsenate reductase/protein-tyrosine-phosphatase family protein n=1 Tax=Homoserinibacter sp. GY 40078 TaxID=2603275 RepID=UPI00164FD5D3|nr:low molecular weight phosphatase family protein [Homoserinibacter sp. GY 40078]
MDAADGPFRILVVCTGNVCRSPQAERFLRAGAEAMGAGADIEVSSAGLAALVGEPMTPQAAREAALRGVDPEGHVARQLGAEMLAEVDLVLTMDLAHRADVVRMAPRLSAQVFTLPEFARLAEEVAVEGAQIEGDRPASIAGRMRAVLPCIAARRGFTAPSEIGIEEIGDPYGADDTVYAKSATAVHAATSRLLAALVTLLEPTEAS